MDNVVSFQHPMRPPIATTPKNCLKILLVEGEWVTEHPCKLMLEEMGYKSDIAKKGEQALAMIENNRYDLILMEVGLSDIDGIDVSLRVRALQNLHRPAIVLLTAFPAVEVKEECLSINLDIDQVITKPIESHVLQTLMARLVAESHKN